jgi:PadR family transcriptional regulator AphA
MNLKIVKKGDLKYIECLPGNERIKSEQDALGMVAFCGENETNRLLLDAGCLDDKFFHLSSGVAGNILLKLSNYYIKTAAILSPELMNQGKFKEWVMETNRGNEFRVFLERDKAEEWLIRD